MNTFRFLPEWSWAIRKSLELLASSFPERPITLYGPNNKPIYLSMGTKIGDTITIRKPQRFTP